MNTVFGSLERNGARYFFNEEPVIKCRPHLFDSLEPDARCLISSSIPDLADMLLASNAGDIQGIHVLRKSGPGRIPVAAILDTLLVLTHADRVARTCVYMIAEPGGFHQVSEPFRFDKPCHPLRSSGVIQPAFHIDGICKATGLSVEHQRLVFDWLESRNIMSHVFQLSTISENRRHIMDEGGILKKDVFSMDRRLMRNFIL